MSLIVRLAICLVHRALNYVEEIVLFLSLQSSLRLVIRDTKFIRENLLGGGKSP